jgi:hypothetical protein
MAQKAHDEPRAYVIPGLRIVERAGDTADDGREGDAARRVALRIEEDFGMADAVGMRTREIGRRQVVEILFGLQDAHSLIIDVEEILEVRKGISSADVLYGREGDGDTVAPREFEHQFGFERPFDMKVQLRLRERSDKGRPVRRGSKSVSHAASPFLRAG